MNESSIKGNDEHTKRLALGQEGVGAGAAQMSPHGARAPSLVALPLGSAWNTRTTNKGQAHK
jgi:hypothetical protein